MTYRELRTNHLFRLGTLAIAMEKKYRNTPFQKHWARMVNLFAWDIMPENLLGRWR